MARRCTVTDPLDLLQEGAAALNLPLSPACLDQFRFYLTELQRWNARVNLTGLRTDRDIIVKGFLDSLAVLPFLEPLDSLADLGSGAGFPGLVLKLARPEMAVTLVEARAKKAAFLEYLIASLRLTGMEVRSVHLTPALSRQWGPRFAGVVSRATFPLTRLMALAAPVLLPGGVLVALRGPRLDADDLETAQKRCQPLGLCSLEWHSYHLPITGEPRLLVKAWRAEEAAADN
jgi:16S rRNA (guanine527-N7)-methyltransferase